MRPALNRNILLKHDFISAKTLTVTSITSSKTAKFGGTVYVILPNIDPIAGPTDRI